MIGCRCLEELGQAAKVSLDTPAKTINNRKLTLF